MKKILVSILVLSAGIFFCNSAMAATAEELADQIAQLQEQLASRAGVSGGGDQSDASENDAPSFNEAYDIAQWVEGITGVRPAFLLAVLSQESNIGKNVGGCYMTNDATGAGVKISTGAAVSRVMKPSRDVGPFLEITAALGKDPHQTRVSCPMSFGYGGAMGPAQWIPSTWNLYSSRLQSILGRPGDPWNTKDSFLAEGLSLGDYGASERTREAEWKAAMVRFAGTVNTKYRFYGDNVMKIADGYEDDINITGELIENPAIVATANELALADQIAQLQEQLAQQQQIEQLASRAGVSDGGDVIGQTVEPGVTQITAVKTYATADGSFENGWKWVFDVTIPADETILKMKFADWANGSNVIPATNNIRFYSAQSTNANSEDSAIVVDAAGEYGAAMNINPENNSDLEGMKGGRQIQITMEARVPAGSASGSYSTSYGVYTEVDQGISIISDENILSTGAITVTVNDMPESGIFLYEGDNNVEIMGINVKANNSEMTVAVNEINLEFNVDPKNYFSELMLFSENNKLGRLDINSSTVTKINDTYYMVAVKDSILKIPADTIKTLKVYAHAKDWIDADIIMPTTMTINVVANGIRAIDRFGIAQYFPANVSIASRNIIINRCRF